MGLWYFCVMQSALIARWAPCEATSWKAVWCACDTFWEFDTAHSGAITREVLSGRKQWHWTQQRCWASCSILDKVFHHKIMVKSNETIRKTTKLSGYSAWQYRFWLRKKTSLPRFSSLQPVGSQGVHQFDARVCHSRGPLASEKTTGFRPVKKRGWRIWTEKVILHDWTEDWRSC